MNSVAEDRLKEMERHMKVQCTSIVYCEEAFVKNLKVPQELIQKSTMLNYANYKNKTNIGTHQDSESE